MIMKICSKCGKEKELNCFEKRFDSKDGYRQYCRECKNSLHNIRLIERRKDIDFFWLERAKYLNNPTGRRRGKASNIIANSENISFCDLKKLYNSNPKCFYCNVELLKEDVTFDHKIPLSKEGTHTIDNLTICCRDCNQLKGIKTDSEFKDFLKNYIKRFC